MHYITYNQPLRMISFFHEMLRKSASESNTQFRYGEKAKMLSTLSSQPVLWLEDLQVEISTGNSFSGSQLVATIYFIEQRKGEYSGLTIPEGTLEMCERLKKRINENPRVKGISQCRVCTETKPLTHNNHYAVKMSMKIVLGQ